MGHDSDIAEWGRAKREESKERRERQRNHGAHLLTKEGIPFIAKNHGAHLIVGSLIDYWPGTGLWRTRDGKREGRGIKSLITFIRPNWKG